MYFCITKSCLFKIAQVTAHYFPIFQLLLALMLLLCFSQINDRQKSFIQILFDCFAIFAVVVAEFKEKERERE